MKRNRLFTLTLTAREIYYLREAFEASFTDPDSRNETEQKIADKLDRLYILSRKPPSPTA